MTTAEQLTAEVQNGKRSRSSIRREFGDELYFAVGKLLRAAQEARMAEPCAAEPAEIEDDGCICPDCGITEIDPDTEECCTKCSQWRAWLAWLNDTLSEVETLAKRHGWTFDRELYGGGTNTRSRYYQLERGSQALTLRVSDHADMYCTSDISLAMRPSGDDHTLSSLERRLQQPC